MSCELRVENVIVCEADVAKYPPNEVSRVAVARGVRLVVARCTAQRRSGFPTASRWKIVDSW